MMLPNGYVYGYNVSILTFLDDDAVAVYAVVYDKAIDIHLGVAQALKAWSLRNLMGLGHCWRDRVNQWALV